MARVRARSATSLDGYSAGPDQSVEDPLGKRGIELHSWVFELEHFRREHGGEGGVVNASTPVLEDATANIGAVVMGRKMFGGGPGDWGDGSWRGWWGENPPY